LCRKILAFWSIRWTTILAVMAKARIPRQRLPAYDAGQGYRREGEIRLSAARNHRAMKYLRPAGVL